MPPPPSDIGMALVMFKEAALLSQKNNLTALGAEFVPPEVPVPVGVKEAETSAALIRPPEKSEAHKKTERRRDKTLQKIQESAKENVGNLALKTAEGMENAHKVIDHYFPEPQEGKKSWLSSPIAAAAVLLIPAAVVVLVWVMWLARTGSTSFELCVQEALETTELAHGIPSNDVTGTRAAWQAVIVQVERCNDLRGADAPPDATLATLLRDAQSVIDALDQIERREGIIIHSFAGGASLTTLVLQGLELYALDNANDLVYRVQLTSNGRATNPNSETPIADMRSGAFVSNLTVGDIIDIAWAEDAGGAAAGRVLIALDTNGVLVSCPARFLLQCTATRLVDPERWVNPVAMTVWRGRLYVLDTGALQIWRYEPSGGIYANPSTEYFSGSARPPIQNAVDFEIDTNGIVYILLSDGNILRFESAEAQPFGFAGLPDGQTITSANALFLNPNPMLQALFVTDRNTRTIYETSFAGTWFNSYRVFDEDMFASISGITADTSLGMIYVASGNSIIGIPRSE
jgi:cell division protein FtsN